MSNEEHQAQLRQFGKHLEKLRKEKKLTLRKLAQNCNIDFSDISRYEKGEINITFVSMLELSEGLGISIKELMNY